MVYKRSDRALALCAGNADYLLAEDLEKDLRFRCNGAFQVVRRGIQHDARTLEYEVKAVETVLISLSADELDCIWQLIG